MSLDVLPRLGLCLALAGLAACAATKPSAAPEPARVAVEILRGSPPAAADAARLALVIDASVSMRASASAGVSRLAAAQTRAKEVIESLPLGGRVSVQVAGGSESAACGAPQQAIAPSPDLVAAAEAVGRLAPGGEGSIAEALQATLRGLAAEGALDGARVVVFGDLEDPCGGDLCAAVGAVVAAGASLDLVVLGDRPTPACVSAAGSGPDLPPGPGVAVAPVRFEVSPATGVAVAGVSGANPTSVPAGPARIQVALVPPLEIGPITLAPGSLVRIRVLDFPASSPPVRDWSLEVVGGADLAASPARP